MKYIQFQDLCCLSVLARGEEEGAAVSKKEEV